MTPEKASGSGFCHSDPCGWHGDPFVGENDPFWGYRRDAAVSTSRWSGVSVVQPDALGGHSSTYHPGYDPTPLFTAPPGRATDVAVPSRDIRQVSVSESAHPAVPSRELTRKRRREVGLEVGLPPVQKPVDRTVQIADLTWVLPPDLGLGGMYPRLIFLIGAAISSSASGVMTSAEIAEWIKVRYPRRPKLGYGAIKNTLSREKDFINIRAGQGGMGLWKLHDPFQFSRFYEADITKNRSYVTSFELGQPWTAAPQPEPSLTGQPAPGGTEGETPFAALPVTKPGATLQRPVDPRTADNHGRGDGVTSGSSSVSGFRYGDSVWGDGWNLSGSGAGAWVPPTHVQQISAAGEHCSEAGQGQALPSTKKLVNRTVQVAGFTWTLPPDPGRGRGYPSLTTLIGAAISSSKSGTMTRRQICQWIRERYPSRPESTDSSIASRLVRGAEFINIRAGKRGEGIWRLCNPSEFGRSSAAEIKRHHLRISLTKHS